MSKAIVRTSMIALTLLAGVGTSTPALAWSSGACQVGSATEIIDDWYSGRPAHIRVTCSNNLDGAAGFVLPIGADPARAARFWAIVTAATMSRRSLILNYDVHGNWTYHPLGGGAAVVSRTERYIYNFGL